jgi:hypothetical protein
MNSGSKDAVDNYLPQNAGSSAIQIDSDPPGAEIFVMGERIGTTPAMISPKKIFPTTYPKDQESLYGRVLLTKDGCADLIKAVSTKVMNTGLHARLECADQHPTPTSKPTEAVDVGGNVEQRLMKIRDLLDKGLITDEEAKRARDRIINNL